MKEIERISQSRRDFVALYKCESCGAEQNISGYDDHNFHVNVVPSFNCKVCGESTNSLGLPIEDMTRVPSDLVL